MRDSLGRSLLFISVLGAVCAAILAATAQWTADRRSANQEADKLRHVLAVLDIPYPPDADPEYLQAIFRENVHIETRHGHRYYWTADRNKPGAVASEFTGRGLWGPIRGIIALREDLETVSAVSFYDHQETPGLGGQISSREFLDRFRNKHVVGSSSQSQLIIRPAGEADLADNEIHGLTGATETTRRVQDMLNETINRIRRDLQDD
ncbi:MAG: FMN-binding protein [Phycisphaerae bacterium]